VSELILEIPLNKIKKITQNTEEKDLFINYNDSTIISKVLNKNKDTLLIKFFNSKGISNEKDIKIILLNSLYRKINNKPINLDDQINSKLKVYRLNEECDKLKMEKIIKSFEYKIGNTVQVRFKVFDNFGAYQTICELSYTDWIYDDSKDMLVKGVVCEKYLSDAGDNVLMNIKIKELNKLNIKINEKIYDVNDTLVVFINYAIIEKLNELPY
jgi:hypothetical protein